jgi:hypothetical protein
MLQTPEGVLTARIGGLDFTLFESFAASISVAAFVAMLSSDEPWVIDPILLSTSLPFDASKLFHGQTNSDFTI